MVPVTVPPIPHVRLVHPVLAKKRDQWGLKKYLARPESDCLRIDAPALRIVSEELWDAAHARLELF
jgi:hypothetical protein